MHRLSGSLSIDASDTQQPQFLPANVVLHIDDANSKVFQAIARAFLSVDNKALTIKDLASLALSHGLVAQNPSAASQAITTYIRQHLQRCEEEDDIPLLCRHTLSGTPSDDQLLPALHSTTGGAHVPLTTSSRTTNFRRGTVVWFLSRATGAPCPFTRAGLRLSDHHDTKPPVDKRLRRDVIPSLKRKRTLRGSSPSADSQSDTEKPPPKVKITLRLKPIPSLASLSTPSAGPIPKTISSRIINISDSADSDVSMTDLSTPDISSAPTPPAQSPTSASSSPFISTDNSNDNKETNNNCLPPYPRRSISIPCYNPSAGEPYLYFSQPPQSTQQHWSLVLGAAESDHDESDHSSHSGERRSSQPPVLADDSDWDADSEADPEPFWEDVSILRSPSVSTTPPPVRVKRESDVQIMLDAWDHQDSMDSPFHSIEHEAAPKVKVEELEGWTWEGGYQDYLGDDEACLFVKEEEPSAGASTVLTPFHDSFTTAPSPFSSASASRSSSRASVEPPFHPVRSSTTSPEPCSSPLRQPLPSSLVTLIESMTMDTEPADNGTRQPCVSPQECSTSHNVIFPRTVNMLAPISATHIEGIPVYHMPLGTFDLLRRIDTDFVNLEPLVKSAGTPCPVWSTIPNATVVSKGSPWVVGTWVALSTAQEYVRDHCLSYDVLDLFLSDHLVSQFPASLQDYHRANAASRKLEHFGPSFGSALSLQTDISAILPSPPSPRLPGSDNHKDVTAHGMESVGPKEESPLSPTEQEIFQTLCTHWGWEEDSSCTSPQGQPATSSLSLKQSSTSTASPPSTRGGSRSSSRPAVRGERVCLRRSKRVAEAATTQSTQSTSRTRRRGSRNTVS